MLFGAMVLLWGLVFAANAPSVPPAFSQALYATQVGPNAAQAYFLVNVLRRSEAPTTDVEALRAELLHRYVAQLSPPVPPAAAPAPAPGLWAALLRRLPDRAKAPTEDVAAAIAHGRQRDNVLGAPLRGAWQAALNQALQPRWESGATQTPLFTLERRDAELIAPGVWASPSAGGQVRLMLSLQLVNTAAVPVPVYRPDIVLQDALHFSCNWDHQPARISETQANTVTVLQPGAVSDLLQCEAAPAPGYWREQLAALQATTGKPGLQTLLVPHDLDSNQRLYYMELAFAEAAPQTRPWGERLLLARQEMHRQWAPAEHALDPPESGRFGSAPHAGWAAAGTALGAFMGATVLALALFAGGRAMLHAGLPRSVVTAATLLVAGGLWLLVTARLGAGGTGYSHPLYIGIALWAAYIGPVLLGVLALHALHKLLDEEHTDWWQTVATGWRYAFSVNIQTSRGEFWGFVAHCAWLWILARICLVPLDRWIGWALLVPLGTLTTRRMLSMTRQEWVELVLMLVCTVLLVLA